MKRLLLSVTLCALFIFTSSGVASGADPPTDPGGLFLVDIDGDRVVLQFWGSEQAWQFSSRDTPGWYKGLAPHPFDHKIWYPHLSDTYDMVMDEHLDWIEGLDYAGIDDWRIATHWDTIPLKASMFGGIPNLTSPNRVYDFDSTVYFPLTGIGTWGRTGNEPCGHDRRCDGAIIEAGGMFPAENYPEDGTLVWPDTTTYYALPRTHGQDHWLCMEWGGRQFCMYDYDINCTPDYLPDAYQPGPQPMGVWTVTEKWPVLEDSNVEHKITISAAVNPYVEGGPPAGTLVPVEIVRVRFNDGAPEASWGNTETAAEVTLPVGSGTAAVRVYHIDFLYEGVEHTFKVTIP